MTGARTSGKRMTLRKVLEVARDRQEAGNLPGARTLCEQVLAAKPDYGAALHLLGLVTYQQGDKPGGIALLERAVESVPRDLQLRINLGRMLQTSGRAEDAVATLETALALDPGSDEARQLLVASCRILGRQEHGQGRLAASMRAMKRAIALAPDDPRAHFQYAESLLLAGNLVRGFEEYEWRWKIDDFPNKPPELGRPLWDGGAIEGGTILIHPEQGLGDSIQFCRYVPLLAERGARVILPAGPALSGLLERLEGASQVIGLKDRLPAFDCHAPILSLPRLLGTTLETIPDRVPYLSPDPQTEARWAERLKGLSGLRVGFAWAGSPKHPADQRRSLDPALLRPLLELPGTSWVSLQTPKRHDDLAAFEGLELLDLADELSSFAETAAVVANLDLVISVDTALGHLAGAIGHPTWLLLAQPPDWRWLLGITDSPWYPGTRLFRQPRPGDWPSAIEAVAEALAEALRERLGAEAG